MRSILTWSRSRKLGPSNKNRQFTNRQEIQKNRKLADLGRGGDMWKELRGGSGGAGGRVSRRGILGDTHGEPLLGDCRRAWSDDVRIDEANDARLLLASH